MKHIINLDPTTTKTTHDMVWGVGVVGVSDTVQWMRSLFVVSPRPISTSQLHPSRGFHLWPINPVV